MRRLPWIASALIATVLVGACAARQLASSQAPPIGAAPAAATSGETRAHAGALVMGTVLEVTVEAADPTTARHLAQHALQIARHWDDVLTTWRSEGELARLNAAAGRGEVQVSRDLAAALRRMRRSVAATGGAFDPGVGVLVDWWRMPAAERARRQAPAGPWNMAALLYGDGRKLRLAAGAALDAGAIGKGLALDAVAKELRAKGAVAAFLDFGGSSQLAFGRLAEPLGEAWVVIAGLAPGAVHGSVALRDASLSTSRASPPGTAAGPIVDPRSGRVVETARLTTVLAADATTAEIWSTALVVLGRAGVADAERAGVAVLLEDERGWVTSAAFPLIAPRR